MIRDIGGIHSYIVGSVLGWGRMVFHEKGWRSEYAKPVALAEPDSVYPYLKRKGINLLSPVNLSKDRINDCKVEFELPFVNIEQLEDYTREVGEYGRGN